MKVGKDQLTGFAVQPKTDCPHINEELADNVFNYLVGLKQSSLQLECLDCQDKSENWFCLVCTEVHCSRYVKGHMAEHNSITGHVIGLSFRDGSYWCYSCDSYIESKLLLKAELKLSAMRTQEQRAQSGEKQQKKQQEKQQKSEQEKVRELQLLFKLMGIKDKKEEEVVVTFEEITSGLKQKRYKNVLVLTGAGLSVAAGIPDFRSPGTGLYSKLQSYNLPYPEAIFELSYFKKHPTAFLTLSKQLLSGNFEPTLGHRFITKLQDQGILLMNMTQNIDDLQVKAGLKEEKLLQAHGHSRSAHCVQCQKECDIVLWKEHAAKEKAFYCECGGLVKPDIVFFGQKLPNSFNSAPKIVGQCDLAIIIGTSLKVNPFAYLANIIPSNVPVVVINRDQILVGRNRRLWLKGDIQENVEKIMKEAGWLK